MKQLTVPQAPHFHKLYRRSGCSQDGANHARSSPSNDVTLAQSTDSFSSGLRDMRESSSPTSKRGVTVPRAPKFHHIHARQLPKSADEREMEMMEYFNSHPFKAKANPFALSASRSTGKGSSSSDAPSRSLTQPQSPRFHRIHARAQPRSAQKTEKEMMQYFESHPFKAREAPPLSPNSRCKSIARKDEFPLPHPKSPTRTKAPEAHVSSPKSTFRARPIPQNTYSPSSSPRLTRAVARNLERARLASAARKDADDYGHPHSFKARPLPQDTSASTPTSRSSVNAIIESALVVAGEK